MIAYHNVVELADQLPLAEKARLIEHLSAALRHDLEEISAALRRELAQREAQPALSKRSLHGLFADLGAAPSADEIDQARREIWGNFPREDI